MVFKDDWEHRPDFIADEKKKREPKRQQVPLEIIRGIQRLGTQVKSLRYRLDLSRREFVKKTGLSLLWIELIEDGFLLPSEITEDHLNKLDNFLCQVFPEAEPFSEFAKGLMISIRNFRSV